ncbi:hypothetical protein [Lactococcus petauri]|uniref:hypothetical protein n=1 Tax=Lactococcus petauri TaxID=1940789 RepID=UPI0022E926A6|nr:hypothetical protein [Lactococcus petauri]
MKLFFLGLAFMLGTNFLRRFVQWGLVAFLEFPLNLTTELLSIAISGLFLLGVFMLGPRKIIILKLIFLLFLLLTHFFSQLFNNMLVSGFDFPDTLAIDLLSFALPALIFGILFAILGRKADVFK